MSNSLSPKITKNMVEPTALPWNIESHPIHYMMLFSLIFLGMSLACSWFPISLIGLFLTISRACLLPAYGGANG